MDRRNEPPDIDVDFEHERREEVIQYIYGKYGRDRAAIAAVVISYRTRSAIRDVGKALGVAEPLVDAFAKDHFWFDDRLAPERLREMAARCGVPLAQHRAPPVAGAGAAAAGLSAPPVAARRRLRADADAS